MNSINKKICRLGKNHSHRCHRKVKCELNQALVMINLIVNVKFIVYYNNGKQVIVLKEVDKLIDGQRDIWRQ